MPAHLSALTPQQAADRDLALWQARRDLTVTERMERLLADFFGPFNSEREYLETLELVSKEMTEQC